MAAAAGPDSGTTGHDGALTCLSLLCCCSSLNLLHCYICTQRRRTAAVEEARAVAEAAHACMSLQEYRQALELLRGVSE